MFSGLIQGKQGKVIHNTFTIHLVVLALRRAIFAAIQWPRLIIFRQTQGHNEEEEKKKKKKTQEPKEQTAGSAVKFA